MIDHLAHIRQLASEINSRLRLLAAHVRALRQAPPPEPETQARLWTDLELLAAQLRGLAKDLEKAQRPTRDHPQSSGPQADHAIALDPPSERRSGQHDATLSVP